MKKETFVPLYVFCGYCNKKLSDQEKLDCEKKKIIPVCSQHEEQLKKDLEQCLPLFQQLKFY